MSQPVHVNGDGLIDALTDATDDAGDVNGLADPAEFAFGSQGSLPDVSSQELGVFLQNFEPVDPAAQGLNINDLTLPGDAYAPPSVTDPRDRVVPWEDLVLKLVDKGVREGEGVHKVVTDEAGSAREYIVSSLKTFLLRVELTHKDTGLPARAEGNRLDVRATLLFENCNAVPAYRENDVLLHGDTEVTVIGGEARLTLKMGANSLSVRRDGRRFRIRIEPRDDALRQEHKQLSDTGAPFKSVTKIERGKASRAQAQPATPAHGEAGTPGVTGVTPALQPTPTGHSSAAPVAGVSPQEHARLLDELNALREELKKQSEDNQLNMERLRRQNAEQQQQMKEMTAENKRLVGEIAAVTQNEPHAASRARRH